MSSQRLLNRLLHESNIHLTTTQLQHLFTFHSFLLKKNKQQNLIADSSFHEIVRKHYVDSLMIRDILNNYKIQFTSLLDLGSGGGFPGIPLAIALPPPIQIFLLEKRKLRCEFLMDAIRILGSPSNVEVICANMSSQIPLPLPLPMIARHRFAADSAGSSGSAGSADSSARLDNVSAIITRAVGPLQKILQLGYRHLAATGVVIFMKGPNCDPEIEACLADAQCMSRYHFSCDHAYQLPLAEKKDDDRRRLLVWRKKGQPQQSA